MDARRSWSRPLSAALDIPCIERGRVKHRVSEMTVRAAGAAASLIKTYSKVRLPLVASEHKEDTAGLGS